MINYNPNLYGVAEPLRLFDSTGSVVAKFSVDNGILSMTDKDGNPLTIYGSTSDVATVANEAAQAAVGKVDYINQTLQNAQGTVVNCKVLNFDQYYQPVVEHTLSFYGAVLKIEMLVETPSTSEFTITDFAGNLLLTVAANQNTGLTTIMNFAYISGEGLKISTPEVVGTIRFLVWSLGSTFV